MEYVKAVYCHPTYFTYMQSTSWEMLDWRKHKLESRLPGEISITSDMQMLLLLSRFSCVWLCETPYIDGIPPGSPIPGILQARTLEWVAISSSAWKWKVKVKLLSCVQLLATQQTAAYQAPPSMDFSRQEYWSVLPSPSPSISSSRTPLNISCRTGLVVMNTLYFCLFRNVWISPSFLKDSLVRNRIIGWQFFLYHVECLLASKISDEKSAYNLTEDPFNVMTHLLLLRFSLFKVSL